MSSPSKSPTMEAVQQSHPQAKASVTQLTAYSTGSPNPIKQFQPAGNEADHQASLTRTPADAIIVSSVAAEADQFSDEEEELNHFNNNQKREQDAFLKSFPPGYRFNPRDDELVLYYLQKKIMEEPLPPNRIMEVNLYRHNPETLAERYENYGEKEWYFFTPRDRKYRNGFRPNRAAGDGYWKATGADKPIRSNGVAVPVGFRKALVFYRGKPPKGNKTNWIMHEYRVSDSPPPTKRTENDMRLDNWVLCRIYKKADSKSSKSQNQNHEEDPAEEIISTSPPENMEVEMNNHFDNTQALESEKAYSCTSIHPPLESNRAYRNYAYPFRGGRPMCFNNNNMLHQNRFQSAALHSGNSYPNMGQMQSVCGTPSPMYFSDQKCGAQFSDQKFTMQTITSESMAYHQCSDQKCAMQFPDRKCIVQPVDVADIGHPSMLSFSDQKSTHQELGKPPSLSSPDQGLQYVEESNEDHNLMFGYPQFVSFENFSWP